MSPPLKQSVLLDMTKLIFNNPQILLLIPLFIVAFPLIDHGIPLTADFPVLDTSNYAGGKLWAWTEKGSVPALETIPRFPIIGTWYVLGLIGIGPAIISKFMIILGFAIASFSFYFSFLYLFRDRVVPIQSSYVSLKFAALIGALFFAYNPWSFERIPHWYLWIGYAALPLFFIAIVYSFRNPKNVKYILLSIFLWSFASTTPHMTVFYGLVLVIVFIAFILQELHLKYQSRKRHIGQVQRTMKRRIVKMLTPFLAIIFLYLLLNVYWIYPYVVASQIREVAPNYMLVEENLEMLSRQSELSNTARLVANWLEQPFDTPAKGTLMYEIWYYASLLLPGFALSSLFVSRKFLKYSSVFSAFAVVGIILAMGTQSPINYFETVLENPILSKYAWVIRDPDKWSFIMALTYSFLIGITSYKILETIRARVRVNIYRPERKRRIYDYSKTIASIFLISTIIGSLCVYVYPVYNFNMFGELRPVPLPSEFDKLNNYLSNVRAERVYYMPYPLDETQWNKMSRVGNIYQTHSIKPSIESSGSAGMAGMATTNYYNYLVKSIIENRSKNIDDLIFPLGTEYLVFHNDTWDKTNNSLDLLNLKLLRELRSLNGVQESGKIGFFEIFKIDSGREVPPGQFNIYKHSIAAVGGLELVGSLNSLGPSYTSLDSSIYFFDQKSGLQGGSNMTNNSDLILLEESPSYLDILASSIDRDYILEPSKESHNHVPAKLWSKAGAMDPDNGYFHPYLERLGFDNWQFDYGGGLIITKAMGANLSMNLDVVNDGEYEILVRSLRNQKGGVINVYLDNKLLGHINTFDEKSNNFVWQNVFGDRDTQLFLKEGRHKLTLENSIGFNAVNLITVVPFNEMTNLRDRMLLLANKTHNLHFLEAESSFKNNKGRGTYNDGTPFYDLLGNDIQSISSSPLEVRLMDFNNSMANSSISGQFRVPSSADLLSLWVISELNQDTNITKNVIENLDLKIYPANGRIDLLRSDFERKGESVPLATLRKADWINYSEETLSTNIDTNNTISGNSSLRVDVKPGNVSEWSVISTDYVPLKDKAYYRFNLNVSAHDVQQLHSKVVYYDQEKERIDSEFASPGRDGTFTDIYSASIVPPIGAKYLKLEILIRPVSENNTAYFIDDLRFEEINSFGNRNTEESKGPIEYYLTDFVPPSKSLWTADIASRGLGMDANFFNSSLIEGNSRTSPSSLEDFGSVDLLIQKTKPLPVSEGELYNYSVTLRETDELPTSRSRASDKDEKAELAAVAYFSNSSDIIEDSTTYSRNASGGRVLSMAPGAEIFGYVDILKPSNYTLALRANPCHGCSFLTITIVDKETGSLLRTENLSLNDNKINSDVAAKSGLHELKWFIGNSTFLDSGQYEIRIHFPQHFDENLDLDSVVVYSNITSDNKVDSPISKHDSSERLLVADILGINNNSQPAYLEEYKKLSPTQYELYITNASRPFVLSLAESYDPLWVARVSNDTDYSNSFEARSMPIYSIVNGFFINRTGDYTLIIEYQPQKWFIQGAGISILALISIVTAVIIFAYHRRLTKSLHMLFR